MTEEMKGRHERQMREVFEVGVRMMKEYEMRRKREEPVNATMLMSSTAGSQTRWWR